MKKEIRLIALDMDGTLLTDEKTISPKTLEALYRVKELGVKMALASGRSPYIIRRTVEEYHLDDLIDVIIGSNGGHIKDYSTNEEWKPEGLLTADVKEIIERCAQFGVACFTYNDNGMYVSEKTELAIDRARRLKLPLRLYTELGGDLTSVKVLAQRGYGMTFSEEDVHNLAGITSDRYYGVLSCDFTMEYMRKGTSKGNGIKTICEANGWTLDNAMAFGDYENDLDMIEMAGVGVAMGNACESAKKIADYITDDNNHDGIAKMLNEYFEVEA